VVSLAASWLSGGSCSHTLSTMLQNSWCISFLTEVISDVLNCLYENIYGISDGVSGAPNEQCRNYLTMFHKFSLMPSFDKLASSVTTPSPQPSGSIQTRLKLTIKWAGRELGTGKARNKLLPLVWTRSVYSLWCRQFPQVESCFQCRRSSLAKLKLHAQTKELIVMQRPRSTGLNLNPLAPPLTGQLRPWCDHLWMILLLRTSIKRKRDWGCLQNSALSGWLTVGQYTNPRNSVIGWRKLTQQSSSPTSYILGGCTGVWQSLDVRI